MVIGTSIVPCEANEKKDQSQKEINQGNGSYSYIQLVRLEFILTPDPSGDIQCPSSPSWRLCASPVCPQKIKKIKSYPLDVDPHSSNSWSLSVICFLAATARPLSEFDARSLKINSTITLSSSLLYIWFAFFDIPTIASDPSLNSAK